MDNFLQLKSSINAIKGIINLDIAPAFDDLSNNSQIMDDLINSQNEIKAILDSIDYDIAQIEVVVNSASSGGGTAVQIGSSNPTPTTNPLLVGSLFFNTLSGELFVCKDNTFDKNVWYGQLLNIVIRPTGAFDFFGDNSGKAFFPLDNSILDVGNSYASLNANTVYEVGKISDCIKSVNNNAVLKIVGDIKTISFFAYFPSTVTGSGYFFDCRPNVSAYCYMTTTCGISGKNGCSIYIDGVISSQFPSNQWCHVVIAFDTVVPQIRLLNHEAQIYGITNVKLDNIRIFNRLLSGTEILQLKDEI